MTKRGQLIVGVGLPGVGKSTVLAALARRNDWRYLAEPEEDQWPVAVNWQSVCGIFTALTWFRAMRVPNLYQADTLRRIGEIVLVDSYYDKLMTYYIEGPQMEWLISRDDPYYELTKQMALLDNLYLPRADVLVFFHTSFENWGKLIMSRKRKLDVETVFPGAFPFQDYLLDAAKQESERSGTRLLIFENHFNTIDNAVFKLEELLAESAVL